jgi:hypothetical protein
VSPADLAKAGKAFCARPWSELLKQLVQKEKEPEV